MTLAILSSRFFHDQKFQEKNVNILNGIENEIKAVFIILKMLSFKQKTKQKAKKKKKQKKNNLKSIAVSRKTPSEIFDKVLRLKFNFVLANILEKLDF